MKKLITPLLIIICIFIMLSSPKTSVYGASNGILLWFNNILPSLLPFMIATNIIVKLNIMTPLTELINRYVHHIKVPLHIIYIIFTGFLCGFPMGGKVINDFNNNGDISDNEASWLISFCNLPSPMFIISYAATECLRLENIFIFISAFYLPLLIIIPFSHRFYIKKYSEEQIKNSNKTKGDVPKEHRLSISLIEKSMLDSYIAIAKIGGYMVVFSIIAAFLEEAYYVTPLIRAILICVAEMTTGINLVSSFNISIHLKTILCLSALGLGGMSCIAQTAGVISSTTIKISHYIIWRLVHATLATLLYLVIVSFI